MKYSIIIPAYNSEKTIGGTLGSIVSQGIKQEYEVIVVDDCSTDGTLKTVDGYKDKLPLTVLKNTVNVGPGQSRQKALDAAKGEYIIFIDSDDEFNANAFDAMGGVSAPIECFMVCSYSQYIPERGKYTYIDDNDSVLHGVMFKKKFLDDNNIRFGMIRTSEDLEFMCDCFHCAHYKNLNIVYFPYCVETRKSNKESITSILYDGADYTESHIDDYLESTAYAAMRVYDKYHDKREGKDMEVPKFLCRWSVVSAYFQIQNSAENGVSTHLYKNQKCIKKCIEDVCAFLGFKNYVELLNSIDYGLYEKSRNRFFHEKIEKVSMYDFIDSCMKVQ